MQVTGIILAGGLSRRMGGQDKGLLPYRGKPLTAWVAERLHPQVDTLLVSANRSLEHYAALGYPIVRDQIPGFAGPLAGLHAAMQQARTPWIASAPCDAPALPTDLVSRLASAIESASAKIAIACSGGRRHPVFCLCRTDLLQDLEAFLRAGGRKVEDWMMRHPLAEVEFEDPSAFANLNTPEELELAS